MATLRDCSEAGLLQILAPFFAAPDAGLVVGAGDDAAVLRGTGDLVVTMDLLLEGVHFSPQTTPAHAVGWRACAANLSDLAAMGATGVGLLVGLGLPPETQLSWVEGVYQGLTDCARPWGVPIVGGDTCRSRQLGLSITALGRVAEGRAWLRSDCRPGDLLVVTGPLGGSRAGLEVLLDPERFVYHDPEHVRWAVQAHQYPQPRLDWVAPLQQLNTSIAAMDTSDGLADALVQMAQKSGVGMVVDLSQIPLTPAVRALGADKALDWALYGGEDFELLLSLPPPVLARIAHPGLQVIGQVIASSATVHDTAGHPIEREQAFAHFA
ncbi:thiamine-phosphate kinase [Anthocerotibacter panamensis]|uniref:thiamine-phosphate kinase n=1 Tax=Anthocerotibacter panamensis TaxID=2857077 RepID=UPI001C407683|nr:thiamine-phosphate kinase [Anthocerotibacter panamensis]